MLLITIGVSTSYSAIEPLAEAVRAIDQKLYYKALNILEKYRPEPDEYPVYYFIKGKALYGLMKYREAIEYLSRAFITSKDKELKKEALYERGLAYLDGGFYYEAASNFKLFIKLFPSAENIQEAYINYAQASLMSGNYEEALRYFKELKENRPEVIFGKAEVFHKLGLYKTAYRLFAKGVKKYNHYLQSRPALLLSYAENLYLNGKYKKAKPYYYILTETYLKEQAYLGLGKIALKVDDLDTALMHFKRALLSADRVIKREAILNIGIVELKKGNTELAVREFLKLRKDYPYTPEANKALLLLCKINREKGKYLKAEKYIKELLFGPGPTEEALDELEHLILETIANDKEAFLKTWNDCGRLLMTIKRQKTLLKVAKTLMLEGGDFLKVYDFLIRNGSRSIKISALSDLAVFYGRLGDKKSLNFYFNKLKRMNIKDDRMMRVVAYKYYLEQKAVESYRALSKIKKPFRSDMDLLLSLSEKINPYDFLVLYKKYIKLFKEQINYQLIGDLFYEHGHHREATKYYKLAIKVGQFKPRALIRVYRFDRNDKDIKLRLVKGKDLYGKYVKLNIMEKELISKIKEL